MRAVVDQWPSYLSYLVSFSTIGAIWLKHTVITEYLAAATPVLIRLNLLLLLMVASTSRVQHRHADRRGMGPGRAPGR